MDVRLIAAVGQRGQIGIENGLPWNDLDDLRWFKEQTSGGVVIAGARTMATIPAAFRVGDHRAWIVPPREVLAPGARSAAQRFLEGMHEAYGGRTLWIAGGARTYEAFMHLVRVSVITHQPYNGKADAYMPPLWRSR